MLALAVSLPFLNRDIRSLVRFGKSKDPLAYSVLYPLDSTTKEAVPKYISGRTSYLQVRLEFLPLPQFIPQFCNIGEFGPPPPVTAASA